MYMKHYLESTETVLRALNTGETGLSQSEAAVRLSANGHNELTQTKPKTWVRRFLEQILNPMVLVLLAAAGVSVAIAVYNGGYAGEYAEAGIILVVVILNSVLGVFQESKAERAIEALREMNAAAATVRRQGEVSRIPASGLVIGDIILVKAGDAIPADVRWLHCAGLRVNETALTGESVPVDKQTGALSEGSGEISLGDRTNMGYMGSSVSYGRGEGIVAATGMNTEMGKIAGIIQRAREGETPLQKRLSQLSKVLSVLVLGICAVVFAVRLMGADTINAEVLLSSFMLAVALAVAAIPEGLAAVVTIVLSAGVAKMAKRSAIIRRLTAVETLGCAQVICTDKTGTLTQNKMAVMEHYGEASQIAAAMALCCDSQLAPDGSILGDPTENALVAFALSQGIDKNALEREYPRATEAPFDSTRKMMSTVHRMPEGFVQYTKGAPDEVLKRCVGLTPGEIHEISRQNAEYASRALRVIACAHRESGGVPDETGLTFLGLAAMIDPVRPESVDAAASCKRSGIKIVMITGDHKDTAAAIARELGIISGKSDTAVMTGSELNDLSDEEFARRVDYTSVYARVQPEHKVRIVAMWKRKGYVTAMAGDGANDAPAIKSSDIGIGMGITGTDVTKNVADMVLADDNFATIVAAIEEGRRIYENIRKTLQFLLSTNLSEVIAVLAATAMGFVLFQPVHLLFINLITDTVPAVALGMERAEAGIMERPPRGQKEGVFSGGLGVNIIYQGVVIALLALAAYFIVNGWAGHGSAMTAAFFTLCMCELFQAFALRSLTHSVFSLKTRNGVLWGALAFSLAAVLAVIYVPFLAGVFSLVPLTARELALALALAVLVLPVIEGVKWLQNTRKRI
jgi:Ca2+-transporting ATPase